MFHFNSTFRFALVAVFLAWPAVQSLARGDTRDNEEKTAKKINAANDLVRAGKLDEAIESYQAVSATQPELETLKYNRAVAEYRKGNIDSAEKLFEEVSSSSDPAIASHSRYNLGNCHYAKGLQLAENDRAAAVFQLEQAIAHYRGSLRGNPENTDARANIELAAKIIRKLKEEQQQQEQQQEDQQQEDQQKNEQQDNSQQDSEPRRNNADKGDPSQDQQEQQQAEPSGSGQQESDQQQSGQQQSDPAQQNQQTPDSDSQSSDESDAGESDAGESDAGESDAGKSDAGKSDAGKSKPGKGEQNQPPSDTGSDPDSNQDQSGQQNSADQESGQQPQQQSARDGKRQASDQEPKTAEGGDQNESADQTVPAGELTTASEQESGGDSGTAAMADPNATDGAMTREEAMKMLQAVRDRDMLRRMQLEQRQRSRRVPVTRDW